MDDHRELMQIQAKWHGTLRSYLLGFIGSLLLTGCAYYLVMAHIITGDFLIHFVVPLALVQAAGQLVLFMHVGKEGKPYLETLMFTFMLVLLLVIVVGSLWVIYDLNYRVMSMMTHLPLDEYGQ